MSAFTYDNDPMTRHKDVTFDMKTAMREVASSGEEDPAAMRVAPATSGVRQRASDTRVSEGTKKSSQTTVRPGKQNKMIT